jgi:hypothetical protein
MKTARIVDGKIAEILNPIPGFTLSECFHPDVLSQCQQVADEAQVGDDYVEPLAEAVAPLSTDQVVTLSTDQVVNVATDQIV